MNKNLFEDQVIVVTGGGRGIGAAACKLFAEFGGKVVVSDRDEEPTAALVDEIKDSGGDAIGIAGDVTDPAFPAKLIGGTVEHFGKINILVNNAGYTWDGMMHKMTDEQWYAMIDVHTTAPFRLIRECAPYMREKAKAEIAEHGAPQENRAIINISSTSGLHGNVGQINYACGKAGIVGMTKTVAKEWGGFGIRCNAVAFGFIETRLTNAKEEGASLKVGDKEIALGIPEGMRSRATTGNPLGRPGSPEEGASGIIMMASPLASYVNGHCLEVTGGSGI
ncbi:MAG: 3-oxoacyl-ACP reductase [Candidatus Hydrogenedentota bacterium]|nr:MAG: 3-oxoacyl-ACP reductase [Candidatus Hydrogenedentota bacterium]